MINDESCNVNDPARWPVVAVFLIVVSLLLQACGGSASPGGGVSRPADQRVDAAALRDVSPNWPQRSTDSFIPAGTGVEPAKYPDPSLVSSTIATPTGEFTLNRVRLTRRNDFEVSFSLELSITNKGSQSVNYAPRPQLWCNFPHTAIGVSWVASGTGEQLLGVGETIVYTTETAVMPVLTDDCRPIVSLADVGGEIGDPATLLPQGDVGSRSLLLPVDLAGEIARTPPLPRTEPSLLVLCRNLKAHLDREALAILGEQDGTAPCSWRGDALDGISLSVISDGVPLEYLSEEVRPMNDDRLPGGTIGASSHGVALTVPRGNSDVRLFISHSFAEAKQQDAITLGVELLQTILR